MSAKSFTERQGQYLAFIDAYTRVHGRPPAETDMQRHFQLSPPSVHQMVLTLERLGHTAASQASRAASRCSSLPKICPFSVTPNPSNPLCRGTRPSLSPGPAGLLPRTSRQIPPPAFKADVPPTARPAIPLCAHPGH